MNLEQIVKETIAKVVAEKKGKDLTGDGKIDSADYLKARSNAIEKAKGLDEDYEVAMAQDSLDSIIRAAMMLKVKMGDNEVDLPAWIQDHITNSENYINQAATGYHESDAQIANHAGEEDESMYEARFKKGEDVGGKGFEFKDIAKKAAKQYGSKEAGQRVAGAIMKKVLNKEGEVDEVFKPKSSFDDYSVGDNVTVAGKKAKITNMEMDDETGERRARVKFEDGTVKKVHINSLDESKESNDDKIEKYKKYTYTLDSKVVKPEITFLNNILKAMLGNKIYNIGTPENGKVELTPESGKKGMYTEDDSTPAYYAIFDINSDPVYYMTAKSAQEMLSRLNGYLKAKSASQLGYSFSYDMSDLTDDMYKGETLPHTITDDFAMVTKKPEVFKKDMSYYPRAIEYKGLNTMNESQELDEATIRRWQHYAGIK